MNQHKEVCRRIVLHLIEEINKYDHAKKHRKISKEFQTKYDRYLTSPQLKICLFYWACFFKFENFNFNEFKQKLVDIYCLAPYMKTTCLHIAVKQNNVDGVQFILNSLNPIPKKVYSIKVSKKNNRVFSFTTEELGVYKKDYVRYILELSRWINKVNIFLIQSTAYDRHQRIT